MSVVATSASAAAAADAAADAPEGAAAAHGHAALAHHAQPAAGDTADTQVQPATHGRLHQTETGKCTLKQVVPVNECVFVSSIGYLTNLDIVKILILNQKIGQ